MKIQAHFKLMLLPIVATLSLTNCATFRGMPTHGGGKRFDEEQRVVSAAIRHAASKMDFSQIKQRRVAIEVTGLETSGTGQAFYPGLQESNSYFEASRVVDRLLDESATKSVWSDADKTKLKTIDETRASKPNSNNKNVVRLVPSFSFNPSLKSNNNITRQDLVYLKRSLEMRLRHDGFQIVPLDSADVYIVVLVDVLGTNLSRKDFGVAYDDNLAATCEMTYYAIDPITQKVIASSKEVASIGDYKERNFRFTPFACHERSVGDFRETIVPLQAPAASTFKGGRRGVAKIHIDPTQEKLNQLSQDADVALESGDKQRAHKLINRIRKIDKYFSDLPELQNRYNEL